MKQLIIIALLGISVASFAQMKATTTPNGTSSKSIKWEDGASPLTVKPGDKFFNGKKVITVFDSVIVIDPQTEKELLDLEEDIKKKTETERLILRLLIRRKYNTDSVMFKRYERGHLIVAPLK